MVSGGFPHTEISPIDKHSLPQRLAEGVVGHRALVPMEEDIQSLVRRVHSVVQPLKHMRCHRNRIIWLTLRTSRTLSRSSFGDPLATAITSYSLRMNSVVFLSAGKKQQSADNGVTTELWARRLLFEAMTQNQNRSRVHYRSVTVILPLPKLFFPFLPFIRVPSRTRWIGSEPANLFEQTLFKLLTPSGRHKVR